MNMSESEEMYLVMIASENEVTGPVPVSIPRLADTLSIQPASVNQMIRKLEEANVVTYIPYKGVELTEVGNKMANRILRHRRLWEAFLVQQLHFSMQAAEPLACKMEHIFPEDAIEKLAKFLDFPTAAPDGKPIPAAGESTPLHGISLTELPVGQTGIVVNMLCQDEVLSFLNEKGIHPGEKLTLLAVSSGQDVLIESENKCFIRLAGSIANKIEIELPNE
ncbi:MAG: metal-dependent transcriptional regulator [Anaerolineaceae bacterium]|jgi:DtxR family Mn-dependent transcriptional regulator